MCFEKVAARTEIVLKRHEPYKWGRRCTRQGPGEFEKLVIKIVPRIQPRGRHDGRTFDVTNQIPLQFIGSKPPQFNVQEAQPNFQLMYYGYKDHAPMVADKRVRER